MNNGQAILAFALAEIERLKIELHDARQKLDKAHAQFKELSRIAEECLANSIVRGGKFTAADAQITEQIN